MRLHIMSLRSWNCPVICALAPSPAISGNWKNCWPSLALLRTPSLPGWRVKLRISSLPRRLVPTRRRAGESSTGAVYRPLARRPRQRRPRIWPAVVACPAGQRHAVAQRRTDCAEPYLKFPGIAYDTAPVAASDRADPRAGGPDLTAFHERDADDGEIGPLAHRAEPNCT